MTVLVIAEHDNRQLASANLAAVSAARLMGERVELLVIGEDCQAVATQAAAVAGVARVQLLDAPGFSHLLPERLAPVIVARAQACSHVVAAATTFGKNLLPRVAALLGVQQVSDITAVDAPDTFQRPIYAGNAIATVRSTDALKVVTVRPTAFEKAAASGGSAAIEAISVDAPSAGGSRFVGQALSRSERPELTSARVVVSGGRGLGSREQFALIERLADTLNGAVGASRAAVDAGFVSNDCQVGQTGKVVAPELYIAVGISGAIQHMAGMEASKVIVAINKDADAPIFEAADYGLVGDLFEIVPELTSKLGA
jgi:electron transfer flavoprotein alpha subunit